MPLLVKLLERQDDDLLLEEVQKALAAMQSDEVVNAIAPFVLDHEKGITVISILKQIKTPLSEKVLLDAYPKTNDIEMQEFLLDALTSQFSERAIPYIEQFIEQDSYGNVFDMGEMFYAHYKTLEKSHPLLDTWRKESNDKNTRLDFSMNALPDYSSNHVAFTKMEPVQVDKIGRNDPCPCGSGKKYKKCCG
ncbi:MAG: SEC-C metal-binding domain-containing protein [Carnobacterium sp.]|uniref:SEC-C metal-binding domain-containing protein n=1 Tax=Carnobacterium sp. TaxID=48221 RepID=UPI002FC8401E